MSQGMTEHTEVSSSRSTEEIYENRQRKGLDGCEQIDTSYLILKDSSCSKEITYLRVGWKLKVKNKNAQSWKSRVLSSVEEYVQLMRAVGNNHKYDFDGVDCQENVCTPGGSFLSINQQPLFLVMSKREYSFPIGGNEK